jgi:beta-lactamase regulating signal transducer with metallopeptidase domain
VQTILQSVFLQALAFALLKSIWQIGLIWLALIFVLRIFKLSSAQKFNIAFIAQICGFALFIYSLVDGYNHQQALPFANTGYINNTAAVINYAMPFIALLYIIFFVRHIIKLIFNYGFTQNLRRNNLVKMPVTHRIFVEEITALFSLKRSVKIFVSKSIRCPLTIGFLKPLILIPLAAVNNLTKEQMEAVILHELAHIKRADYLFYLLQCVIEKIFFFNIFSKMINDIIERERENACDDWVIQFKYNSFHYAEALLKLGKLQAASSLAMAASGKKESVLLHRIKRLIHGGEKAHSDEYPAWRFSFLTLIIAIGLLASFSSKTDKLLSGSNAHQTLAVSNKNSGNNILTAPKIFMGNSINNNTSVNKITSAPEKKTEQKVFTAKVEKDKKVVADSKNISSKTSAKKNEVTVQAKAAVITPDYFVSVNQHLDSVTEPSYAAALNKQIVLNKDDYKQALSYQNFRQLETMLALTGDSITVTEDPQSQGHYKKLITIQTTDKNGNKHVYKVIVEVYQ